MSGWARFQRRNENKAALFSYRFDRCIDYIWVSEAVNITASGLCFNKPALDDPNLWPSDPIGVWADLEPS